MNTIGTRLQILIFFAALFLLSHSVFAGQKLELTLDYPQFDGDFYAAGVVSFPPRAVPGSLNMAVFSADTGLEIESKISVLSSWADKSVQKAQIIFPANAARKQKYMIGFGEDVRRQKGFEQTAVLPTVSFFAGGAPRAVENVNLNVGTINVRVDRSPGINYFWHIIPIVFLVWLTWYRTRRVGGDA